MRIYPDGSIGPCVIGPRGEQGPPGERGEITTDSLAISGGRSRGRPRVEEPRASVSTWLPASYHDRLIKMANNRNESVSSLVKSLLMLQLKKVP